MVEINQTENAQYVELLRREDTLDQTYLKSDDKVRHISKGDVIKLLDDLHDCEPKEIASMQDLRMLTHIQVLSRKWISLLYHEFNDVYTRKRA